MIQKIKAWWSRRKHTTNPTPPQYELQEWFTRDEVRTLIEEARSIGYSDGKRDGLAIAREQASNSLKEILRQQNRSGTN